MPSRPGVEVVYQAAQSEGDQLGQLSIAENLISQGFNALLLSPQTDSNLQPALESAEAQGIPVINVNDAVIPSVRHYVGNVQRDNGVRVAKWFLENRPEGGKVAVIEGQAGVFAAGQRTKGFTETITEGGKFTVVASVPGNWDRQLAYDAAATILQQNPDLVGFYANNDGMALGVVEAVKAAGAQDKVVVFGTDGISDAYTSIQAGELTGTVDSFPVLTGEVAMEAALRLLGKQDAAAGRLDPAGADHQGQCRDLRGEGRRAAQGPAGAARRLTREPARPPIGAGRPRSNRLREESDHPMNTISRSPEARGYRQELRARARARRRRHGGASAAPCMGCSARTAPANRRCCASCPAFSVPRRGTSRSMAQRVVGHGPVAARRAGIAMIHQELQHVPELTVAQNMFLGHPLKTAGGLLVARRKQERRGR